MPVPLKIALDLLAENSIKVKDTYPLNPDQFRLPKCLDKGNTRRLTRMRALQGRAKEKAVQFLNEQELLRIEQAFHRLENGDFGYCLECKAKISLHKLEQDPTATHCCSCDTKQQEDQ